jgi:hypothetical protein
MRFTHAAVLLITSHAGRMAIPSGRSWRWRMLEALGKDVRLVNADPAPEHYMDFPASIGSRSRAA